MVRVMIVAAALAAGATAAAAKEPKVNDPAPPPVYREVIECRGIGDAAARLACFDRSVAAMAAASEEKELVVMDRAAVREARRGLFGLSLPNLRLFGGGEGGADEVREIESTVSALSVAPDGNPIFILADGAVWKQTAGRNVFAKVGDPIRVRRAALGSYMASVDKKAGVRVTRLAN